MSDSAIINEDFAQHIIKNLPGGVVVTDLHGKILDINYTFKKYTGWQEEQLIGSSLIKITGEISHGNFKNYGLNLKHNNPDRRIKIKKSDQSIHNCRIQSNRVEIDTTSYFIHLLDFTKKTSRQDAPVHPVPFEESPIPKLIYDFESLSILEVNSAALNQYGYTLEEFREKTILDLRPKRFIPALLSLVKSISSDFTDKRFGVFTHITKAGTILKVEVTGTSITHYGRNCVLVTCNDITGRQEALKQLKDSNKAFEYVTKATYDAIWEWNLETGITHRAKGFIDNFGYTQEQLDSKKDDWCAFVVDEDRLRVRKSLSHAIETGELKWKNKYQIRKPDGSISTVQDRAYIIRKDKEPVKIVGALKDITNNYYYDSLTKLETKILEMNALGKLEISEIVKEYILGIENLHPNMKCSLNGIRDNRLYTIAAPSLPEKYLQETNNIQIGDGVGTCGTAAYLGRKVIVENVKEDKNWQPYLFLLDYFNFRACWSQPIKHIDGTIVATFACYYPKVATPSRIEENTINRASHILFLLFQSHLREEALRQTKEKYELVTQVTSDAVWVWEIENNDLFLADSNKRLFRNLKSNNNRLEAILDRIPKKDKTGLLKSLIYAIRGEQLQWHLEHRFLNEENKFCFINNRASIIRDENGKAVRLVGAMEDITAKKQERDRLKLMESVVTNTKDSILITEASKKGNRQKIIFANNSFLEMTGYGLNEILGRSPRVLQGPNTDPDEALKIIESLANQQSMECTILNYRKNGEEFWVNLSLSPLEDKNGKNTHWIAIQRDVTERKVDEIRKNLLNNISAIFNEKYSLLQSINLSLEKLAQLDELDMVEVWLLNTEMSKIKLTGAYYKHSGLQSELGNSVKIRNGLKKGEGIPGIIWESGKEIFYNNISVQNDFLRNRAAHQYDLKALYGLPLFYKGTMIGAILLASKKFKEKRSNLFTISADFGEFFGSEIKRKQIEIELQQMFTYSVDLICIIGSDGYFKRVNPAISRILNMPEEELLKTKFIDLIHSEDREQSIYKLNNLSNGLNSIYFENRFITHTNDIKWIGWTISEALEDGLIFGIGKDITENKENQDNLSLLNSQLISNTKELAQSNKELEQYAYIASHDLQEPLRMVSSFLTKIEQKYKHQLDDKGKLYIHYAVDGANRMKQTILDLLEYSKITSNNETKTEIDLNLLIDEIGYDYSTEIESKKAKLKYEALPLIIGYRSALRLVFQNLIENALKYSKKDEPTRIYISALDKGDCFEIKIEDNGIGIKQEYHQTIFQLFHRLHSSREYSGTGVGLAVVKKILDKINGKIRIESAVDIGSKFYVELPKLNCK